MKVLIFHGYMLRGTGSNIYNANLAPALARLGHEVHLLCQEREVALPGVEIHNPDIGGLLPVYVSDPYPGFRVKAFEELSEAELDRYLDANVAAVRAVAAAAGGIDLALANHLVMGPAILARAGVAPFAAKIHGSALEYTVKPHPRFLPYAKEGMEAATGVLVGSRHTAESLWAALPDVSGLVEKTRLGPPGVDLAEFRPAPSPSAPGGSGPVPPISPLPRVAPGKGGEDPAPGTAPPPGGSGPVPPISPLPRVAPGKGGEDDPARNPPSPGTGPPGHRTGPAGHRTGPAGHRTGPAGRSPLVVFVGKLIVSKGVDLLLAAWPLVRAAHPDARLLIAGFGAYEDALRQLLGALDHGDLDGARSLARRGRALEGGEEAPLPILSAFLASPPPGYLDSARGSAAAVEFIGRLEHHEVAALLPHADAMVMPSTFPEAFGMVAVEAAACGALPISAAHSGMLEVSRALAADLPPAVAPLLSFPLEEGAVEGIARRLNAWLTLPLERRQAAREALLATVARLWSWEAVARGVLSAAAGDPGPQSLRPQLQ